MKRFCNSGALLGVACLALLSSTCPVWAVEFGESLAEKEWEALGLVTGYHSVHHKESGLEARLLEADGSASVAWDPVALYLVVTNSGTSHRVQRIWRVPRGVARVRGFVATSCGADVRIEVDRISSDGLVNGTTSKALRLCFLSADGQLQPRLTVNEVAR
jgi:hypothetical protein